MQNLRFVKDDSAAICDRIGLIAVGISVAFIAAISEIGASLNGKFNSVSTQLR